jgi:hypothetical protein
MNIGTRLRDIYSPSETLDARSKTPTTGLVTALTDIPNSGTAEANGLHNVPYKPFAHTFEKAKRTFRLGSLDWLHLYDHEQCIGVKK